MNLIHLNEIALSVKNDLIKLVNQDEKLKVSESHRDIKIQLDFKLHEFLKKELFSRTNIEVISEEGNENKEGLSIYWLIDPLDGSLNYYRNIEHYFTSISLIVFGECKIGILIDLVSGRDLYGIKGNGVYLEKIKLERPTPKLLKESIVATGIPTYLSDSDRKLSFWKNLMIIENEVKKIRMFGSAAASLFLLATGSVDMYFEINIASWDVKAGIMICKELGMYVTEDWNGNYGRVLIHNSRDKFTLK